MSISKKIKHTLDCTNDIRQALMSKGFDLSMLVLKDYSELIRILKQSLIENTGLLGGQEKMVVDSYFQDSDKLIKPFKYHFDKLILKIQGVDICNNSIAVKPNCSQLNKISKLKIQSYCFTDNTVKAVDYIEIEKEE